MSDPTPLPTLAKQHRIVAKIDELMAICDRLEASSQEVIERRIVFFVWARRESVAQ
jgi:restriction endonuclease S subunit